MSGIRLGLVTRHKPFKDDRGVYRMDGQEMVVVDLESGAPVTNLAGMIWGPGSILMEPSPDEGIFTREHFDPAADYLVVVVRCDGAQMEYRKRS